MQRFIFPTQVIVIICKKLSSSIFWVGKYANVYIYISSLYWSSLTRCALPVPLLGPLLLILYFRNIRIIMLGHYNTKRAVADGVPNYNMFALTPGSMEINPDAPLLCKFCICKWRQPVFNYLTVCWTQIIQKRSNIWQDTFFLIDSMFKPLQSLPLVPRFKESKKQKKHYCYFFLPFFLNLHSENIMP